jgi:CheY-like chemotaxis protein
MDSVTAQPSRLLLLGEEPVLHALLRDRMGRAFTVGGHPGGQAESLALARTEDAHVVLIDADTRTCDPSELVTACTLLCAAPVVALSAAAALGSPAAVALLQAGAHAVLHKPAGRLPLDLDMAFGDRLAATLLQAAGA